MNDKRKHIGSIVFVLIVFAVTCYIIFKDNSPREIIEVFKTANIYYLLLGMSMIPIYIFVQGYYLKIILKYLGYKIKFIKGCIYSCIEFYFSGITPSSTGGQPAEMYYMRRDGVPVGVFSIAVLLITAIFKIVLILLGLMALLFNSSLILSNGITFNIIFFLGLFINSAIIFGCLFLMFSKNLVKTISTKTIRLLGRFKLTKYPEKMLEKFEKHLEEYSLGAKYIKENLKLSLKVILLTLLQRVAMFSVGYFVYRAMGLSEYSYFDIMFIQVAIALAIDSLPFPGGMGITEVMLLLIYDKIFGEDIAIPAMLLTRIISYYFCMIISSITTLVNHVVTSKKQVVTENEEKIKEIEE